MTVYKIFRKKDKTYLNAHNNSFKNGEVSPYWSEDQGNIYYSHEKAVADIEYFCVYDSKNNYAVKEFELDLKENK